LTSQITDAVSRAMGKSLTLTIMGWQQFEPDVERIRAGESDESNVIQLCPPAPKN